MADTCFLCEMGGEHVFGGRTAGEGFGTCYSCSVHACPLHGDRTFQYFRCADCVAAAGANSALTEPASSQAEELQGEAPRLSALSAELRGQFDPGRMGESIGWVHRQAREGGTLLPGAEHGFDVNVEENALTALGFSSQEEVDRTAAMDALRLRAVLVEERVRDLATRAELSADELSEEQRLRAGETAAASLAIAYTAHGATKAAVSPFEIGGGLMLPPAAVVLGHTYAVATDPPLATG